MEIAANSESRSNLRWLEPIKQKQTIYKIGLSRHVVHSYSYKSIFRKLERDDTKIWLNEIWCTVQYADWIYRLKTVSSVGSCTAGNKISGFMFENLGNLWTSRNIIYISRYCPSLRALTNNIYVTGHINTVTYSNYCAVDCNRIQLKSLNFKLNETQFGVKILIEEIPLYP